MYIRYKHLLPVIGCVCLLACNDHPSKNHGPILLGDSSTIVTENDPKRLQDLVTDLTPDIPSNTTDTAKPAAVPAADTAKKAVTTTTPATPAPAQLPAGPGLKAEFKETTVMIPGIDAKIAGRADLSRANGAVYTLSGDVFKASSLRTTGNVTKASQRYQSIVILKTKNGMLPLDALSETTPWEQMKGSNGNYRIDGLDESSLEYPTANANSIRNAVTKACQHRHMSRKKIQEWLNALGNVKAPNQRPLVVTLRSVMWKIDGKDEKGKMFSKQIRVDVPM